MLFPLVLSACSLDVGAIGFSQPVATLDDDSGGPGGRTPTANPGSAGSAVGDAQTVSEPAGPGGAGGSGQTDGGVRADPDAALAPASPFNPVDPGKGTSGKSPGKCQKWLDIVVRDFTEAHPDFEKFNIAALGLVKNKLGDDRKPVYASAGATIATAGPSQFRQWYNDVDGVNQRLATRIEFVSPRPGSYLFDSAAFFPIDNMGFGNGPKGGINVPGVGAVGANAADHNFLFTTEAHLRFVYRGGETLTFRGDDDMWLFLNDKLVIDLGGPHVALSATINLDSEAARLGLEPGESYVMDIFHAERHTDQSNYRLETTIDMSCIENVQVK